MNKNMIASVKEMLKDGPVKVSEVKAKLKVKTKVDDFAEELKDAGFEVCKQGRAWVVTGAPVATPAGETEQTEPEPWPVPTLTEYETDVATSLKAIVQKLISDGCKDVKKTIGDSLSNLPLDPEAQKKVLDYVMHTADFEFSQEPKPPEEQSPGPKDEATEKAIKEVRHPDKAGVSTDKVECEVAILEIVNSGERPIEQQLILDRLASRFRRSEIIDALKVLVANGDINLQGRGGWITYWPKDKPLNATRKEKS